VVAEEISLADGQLLRERAPLPASYAADLVRTLALALRARTLPAAGTRDRDRAVVSS